jgi:hypothetical protein
MISRLGGRAAAALATLAALAMPAPAGADAFQPIGVSVDGGEESWHPDPVFAVRWSNPAGVAAVHYRLLDPADRQLGGDVRIAQPATALQHLTVPEVDGSYTVEVWLEDGGGGEGPAASAGLRFDASPPGDVEPSTSLAWIGRGAFPLTLRVAHPDGPLPVSGIRGYAVSVDRAPDGEPCEDRYLCGESETDLREGIGDDVLEIDSLPEGTSYAHAVAVSGSGVRSASAGTAILRVDATDPTTTLAGAPSGWSNRPVRLEAAAVDGGSGMSRVGDGSEPFTAIRVDGGSPVTAVGPLVATTVVGNGAHTVAYYARDAAGNVDDGGSSNGQPNRQPPETAVKIDREPPRVAFANAQDPADPERIDAIVADALSGADASLGSVAVRPAGSTERFRALPTAVSGSRLSARWDSQGFDAGEYEFRATAYDRAGNVSSTTTRANGTPMRLRNPLKVPTTLVAAFRHGDSSALPCGRRATIEGRLTAGRGTSLAGEPVRVLERFAAGSDLPERVTATRTGRGGEFSLRLGPGPSRTVVAIADPTARRQGARSRGAALAVRSCVALRVSSSVATVGGRPIVFRGRVDPSGVEMPRKGVPIELQFRLPGLPWSEFRTVQTDGRGRFRYAYRFADDDSRGVRFQFRAFVAARAGWPFEPAGSPPVGVLGR